MSGYKKYRNVALATSFVHTNPGPKTEPPFSALGVPNAKSPTRTQSDETSNSSSVTNSDK